MIQPLLAAVDDWVKLAIPAVLLLYAIIQLIASKAAGAQPRKPQRRPMEPAERPLGPQQPGKPAAGPQAQLNAEIEQFLRRAGERGDRSRRPAAASVKSPPKPAPRPPLPSTADVRSQSSVPPPPRREMDTVTASVEKHLANRGFAERAEHLADDVVHAEQQLEQHVKKVFGRKVGTLDQASPPMPSAQVTDVAPSVDVIAPASAIAALLANPQHVKQALVLSEILTRPEHRW